MNFTVVSFCWCIELQRESWMRLTYSRELVPERGMIRDFLISAEPISAPLINSESEMFAPALAGA